ncbi:hypothetical protein BN1013_00429 [Candidatus Rubidus massiliensis]|nr:hypothetical protein BN1013_00429 [Candidatus Rubidus massiliensis]
MQNQTFFPNLGIGIGLRSAHYHDILTKKPKIDWFEIISENYMEGGKPLEILQKILHYYPVVQHGVSLAIGSPTPLDFSYLKKLKELTKLTKTPWISDHLCWGRLPGAHFHDLLPLPYTKSVVNFVVQKAKIVQDYLELPFALENLSSYLTYNESELTEWEFYSEIVEKAGIYMMLDINNVYVSSKNHGFDPIAYLNHIPFEKVIQMHIAGHTQKDHYFLDTHNDHVAQEVWDLYGMIYPKVKDISVLLEWDDDFISLEDTLLEANKAKQFQTLSSKA